MIPHDVTKALVNSLAKAHESARDGVDDDDDDVEADSEHDIDNDDGMADENAGSDAARGKSNFEATRETAQVVAQAPAAAPAAAPATASAAGQLDPQKPARAKTSSSSNHRAGNHHKGSKTDPGRNRSSEEEVALSSWSWPAESAFADSASSPNTSSVAAGSGEAVVVQQLAFNGWSSDVVRVARPGPLASRRKASIAKPLLIASLLCGAVLLYRGTLSDKGIPLLHSRRDSVTTVSAHEDMPSQDTDKGRRGQKAGAEAAEGETVEGGEEHRREGTGEEASEEEGAKGDEREIGEGEGGNAVGEGEVTKGMGAGGWRGMVVGRGREERMRVVVAPHVNPEHARMLEGLKELQVIDADVAPAGICTRREFATWLMAFSEKLSASPTDRVYPAMFIEGISEQAYADVAPDDKDFAAIQASASTALRSPLTRQDLLTWRFALEYSHLPPPDLAALRHTCGLIDAARISPAAQRAVSFDLLHHRGGMDHQPEGEGEGEGWGDGRGKAGGKGLGEGPREGQGSGQVIKSAANAAVIPLVFGNVRRFDPLKPVTHAQAAAALTFGRTYETVNEAAVRVEVAEARKEADVARQEAESARREAARLAEEIEKVRVEEEESVRREREERESVEKERESLRDEVERLRAEIVGFSSGGDGGGEGEMSGASGGLEGGEEEEASGVARAGEEAFVSGLEARGGGASVEGSASDGTEEGSVQEPAILPPGWWADLIQQRAEEATHGAAKNLVKIKERSTDVASSLAASVADGSLQRSMRERAEEAARKVQELRDADLKEGARMVREQVGGEVARRIEGVREVGERMVAMGREEAGRMVRVGKGVMDRGVREIREKAGYRWAAGKKGSSGSIGSAVAAAGAGGGVKKL
ncbi:unnamed protein product [Closterium sp. Naga37s-1]|nr:unnamed protein product [Closterium sp. Naga37s-1]